MKVMRPMLNPAGLEFCLKLHGLWKGLVRLPRPPPPPFDIETLRRIEPPWWAIKQWIPDQDPVLDWFNRHCGDREEYDQRPEWQPDEVMLYDWRILERLSKSFLPKREGLDLKFSASRLLGFRAGISMRGVVFPPSPPPSPRLRRDKSIMQFTLLFLTKAAQGNPGQARRVGQQDLWRQPRNFYFAS